jgi:uncharacterized protein
MKRAFFRFFDDLEDLLPLSNRGKEIICHFNGCPSVKHLIESLGVPHTEIGQIIVNSTIMDTSYMVQDGDRVEVLPARSDPHERDLLQEKEIKFILDSHLGKLAAYLRMLGFDALSRNDYEDRQLAEVAELEGRILLTRDRRLLMRKQVQAGYCIRKHNPQDQLKDVLNRFGLYSLIRPFQRCIRCNTRLEKVSKEQVLDMLEPLTKLYYSSFSICPACHKVYWPGSHYEHMQRMIQKIISQDEQD